MQLNFVDYDPAYEQVALPALKDDIAPMSDSPEEMEYPEALPAGKSPGAFKTISEASAALGVPQHVLRFWESRFPQIKPMKLRGGRRYYRPEDMTILGTIKDLLYTKGYTIEGAKKAFGGPAAPAPSTPVITKTAAPFSDKQHSQLAVIRQELVGLRDILKPYIY